MLMRVLMTLVLGIALVATVGCGPKPSEPAPSGDGGAAPEETVVEMQVEEPAEPEAAPAEAPAEPEAEMEVSEPAEGSEAEEAAEGSEAEAEAEAAAEALTAETIVGTKWEYQGITIEMQEDNKVLINDYIEGTWELDGDVLTLSSDMGDYEASIDGAAIVYDGAALNRVQ